ncbi:MAG: hypothetical protein PHW00_02745 [Clostridia bacterium]|nr:hypothetical protein [Clostridia bacterium]
MDNMIEIVSDVFDIACWIRSLGSYKVVYNLDKRVFQVRDAYSNALCVTLYDRLDYRSVYTVYSTMRQHADEIFALVERHNAQLDRQAEYNAQVRYEQTLENIRRMI